MVDFIKNRHEVLKKEDDLFKEAEDLREDSSKIYLNLGCGGRILEGFINIDKYYEDPQVINSDIKSLPYSDKSVDCIFCSHVLEHLPIRHAKLAIKEWERVLKDQGRLFLSIPDLEVIIIKFLDPTIDSNSKEWLLYTLFGFQTNPGNTDPEILDYPVDLGQFHTGGFTKETISDELKKNGFIIRDIFNFDGWGTPSIWVEAYV